MADWNALMNAPNAGASFANAFQQAQQRREQSDLRRMQMQEHQEDRKLQRDKLTADTAKAQVEQHRESIKVGAQILRQLNPQDQAGWDHALQVAQQYGVNPDQIGVPRQFDPTYAKNIIGLADALDPEKGRNPIVIDGVAMDPKTGQPLFESPYPRVVSGQAGFYEIPRFGFGRGGQQPPAQQGHAVSPTVPPPPPGFQVDGGPTPPASGGF